MTEDVASTWKMLSADSEEEGSGHEPGGADVEAEKHKEIDSPRAS